MKPRQPATRGVARVPNPAEQFWKMRDAYAAHRGLCRTSSIKGGFFVPLGALQATYPLIDQYDERVFCSL